MADDKPAPLSHVGDSSRVSPATKKPPAVTPDEEDDAVAAVKGKLGKVPSTPGSKTSHIKLGIRRHDDRKDSPSATPLMGSDAPHLAHAADGSSSRAALHMNAAANAPAQARAKDSLLLVEDVRVSQQIARVALSRAHFKVDVAADGEDAVQKFKTGSYHIVLMDIQLPKMNGIEATAIIRKIEADENRPRTVIFGLTGSVGDSDLDQYKRVGMNGCIAKGNLLESSVREALDEHSKNPNQFVVSKLHENSPSSGHSPQLGSHNLGSAAATSQSSHAVSGPHTS